ncbi:hypothetical protein QJS10_CPB14g00588 [Acorus calamus]|uniref:Uncharacterized protein n=1 Tax=Acorus calamus TaxID=4465 RepID=A0AAV9DA88_ACOCL|nr:hypothetical protein QJS10_CPB14g00588 [Acorus calamus]
MEEDQLFKIIEEDKRDVKCHGEEAEKMIRIGMWCSQSDHNRRPTMSMVVKVLEGVMDLETAIDHNISTQAHATWYPGSSSIVVESVLSGPR